MEPTARKWLFFCVCVVLRLAFVVVAYLYDNPPGPWTNWAPELYLPIKWTMVGVTVAIGLGFIVQQVRRSSGAAKNTGAFGEPAYWNGYVHGALYLAFALSFALDWQHAWIFLLIDVVVGILTMVNHYWGPNAVKPRKVLKHKVRRK